MQEMRTLPGAKARVLRRLLLKQRFAALAKELQDALAQSARGEGWAAPDAAQLAAESQDREVAISVAEVKSAEIAQLEQALQSLDAGAPMDRCADCGRRIACARRRALPEATRCVSCQKRWEGQNRAGRPARAGWHRLGAAAESQDAPTAPPPRE